MSKTYEFSGLLPFHTSMQYKNIYVKITAAEEKYIKPSFLAKKK